MGFLKKLISPVTDLVGGTLNSLTGVNDTAKRSYDDSVRLMELENANNIALWNMQNAYNTPAAQMARMKEAGIDINPMTYAVGNGNMSTTASSVATSAPHMPNYSGAGNPISALMSVMSGIKNLEVQEEQIENMKKERELKQKAINNWEHDHASPYKDIADAIINVFGKNAMNFVQELSDNYGSGYASKHQPKVYDESKPALGANLKEVPKDWKFTWLPW